MNRDVLRQWTNVIAVIATLAVNGLANALPLNGQTTAAVSDKFKVLFVPAGYVFAIWGVIYVALIAFAVFQALPAQRENPKLRRIGYLFALSSLANMAWLFAWHYENFPLTLVLMLALLLLLIAIYLRLDIGRAPATAIEKWCVYVPFGIYLGWISVATIANVTDVLYYFKWDGFGIAPEIWAVVMLVAGLALAAAMGVLRGDLAYVLVLMWAYAGIALKQAASPIVSTTAWVLTAALVLLLGWVVFLRKRIGVS